ncbi:MAG TPA: hypothetical protein VG797_10580 [Phycisphaerales bacterium]|nr:hypothetical protein [Phycisphaerales bacterium]
MASAGPTRIGGDRIGVGIYRKFGRMDVQWNIGQLVTPMVLLEEAPNDEIGDRIPGWCGAWDANRRGAQAENLSAMFPRDALDTATGFPFLSFHCSPYELSWVRGGVSFGAWTMPGGSLSKLPLLNRIGNVYYVARLPVGPVLPIWSGLAANVLLYSGLWVLVLALLAYRRARLRFRAGMCPSCAYDARGLPSSTCPECGGAVERPRLWACVQKRLA